MSLPRSPSVPVPAVLLIKVGSITDTTAPAATTAATTAAAYLSITTYWGTCSNQWNKLMPAMYYRSIFAAGAGCTVEQVLLP
jgi:hypothetical protein